MILSELVALAVGLVFREYVKPCFQNTFKRHFIAIFVGILIGHFFYGSQILHLFAQASVVYLAIELCPRKYVHL